jgi:hypothetical protein
MGSNATNARLSGPSELNPVKAMEPGPRATGTSLCQHASQHAHELLLRSRDGRTSNQTRSRLCGRNVSLRPRCNLALTTAIASM